MEYNHIQKPLTSAQKGLWGSFAFSSILLLLLIQSFFLSPIKTSAQGNSSPITRDIEVTLTSHAERFSDLEYWQYNPKGEEVDYRLLQSESDMLTDQIFKLGDEKDGREGCVETIDTRRTGTCEDGIYKFKMRSTDAAGNKSDFGSYQIERDTVRPGKADIDLIVMSGSHTLDLTVNGEAGSTAKVKVWGNGSTWYKTVTIPSSGSIRLTNLVGLYYPATKYTSEVILTDRAGNISVPAYDSVITPSEGYCTQGSSSTLTFPVRGNFVKSGNGDFYASRLGSDGTYHRHNAQDFTYYTKDQPLGKPIYAAESGYIERYGVDSYGGLWILIYHPQSDLRTFYLHFDTFNQELKNRFNSGERVNVGINTVIGTMGSSGNSTGPHLHFEVRLSNGTKVNPMNYLGECRGTGPQTEGTFTDYPKVDENTAVDKFEQFIRNNLRDETEIETKNDGTRSYGDIKDNLREKLNVHNWCGIWIQDFQYIKEKNGESGYDGAAILNPFDNSIYLVKSGIWDKYISWEADEIGKGPCGRLGVPKNTSGHYSEENAHKDGDNKPYGKKLSKARYQRFETGVYHDQSIYWYEWKTGCFLWWDCETNSRTFAVIDDVSNKYENSGGTWEEYGFPKGDTYAFECGGTGWMEGKGRQWFEGKELSLCPLPMSGSEPVYRPELLSDAETLNGFGCFPGEALQCTNNCYSYAVNDINNNGFMCKPQPGVFSGFDILGEMTCANVSSKALSDGVVASTKGSKCDDGYYKTALVVDNKGALNDYHWYRQDSTGYWSGKSGWQIPTNLDASNNLVTDPQTANRNVYYDNVYRDELNYDEFCGYYCVPTNPNLDVMCNSI